MSGNAFGPYNIPNKHPLELAQRHAHVLGLKPTNDTTELIAELRTVKAADIVESTGLLKIWSHDPLTLYRPVLEEKRSAGAFLTLREEIGLVIKPNKRIPWLQGIVQNDGAIRAAQILTNKTLFDDLNAHLDEILPKILELSDLERDVQSSIVQRIRDQYFNGSATIPHYSQRFIDVIFHLRCLRCFFLFLLFPTDVQRHFIRVSILEIGAQLLELCRTEEGVLPVPVPFQLQGTAFVFAPFHRHSH